MPNSILALFKEDVFPTVEFKTGEGGMQIKAEVENEIFNLEISIGSTGYFKPAKLEGHPDNRTPEEYEPLEFTIESAVHEGGPVQFTWSEWNKLNQEEKQFYSDIETTRIRLKNNNYSNEEYDKIIENIYLN